MTYLIDTCVLSELIKPEPNPNVVRWLQRQAEDHLFLSVITIAELRRGAYLLPASRR